MAPTGGGEALEALLLCDAAVRDPRTGKWTLHGVFDAIWANAFPAVHQSLDVYFRIRSGAPTALRLACRAPSGEHAVLASLSARPAPRGVVEGAVRVQRLPLAGPGDYRLELDVAGRTLGAATLTAALARPAGEPVH